jgi:hypothetical protein
MEVPKVIGRIWYAHAGATSEVHLLDNHTCILIDDKPVPLDLTWGLDGNTYVFKMPGLPDDVDQVKLPVLVDGGLLTGNHATALQMTTLLKSIAFRASIEILEATYNSNVRAAKKLLSRMGELTKLPTIFESLDDDESSSTPIPVAPQVEDAEDDEEEEG